MASLIPKYIGSGVNDPRARKTFTYSESDWHTEMNRNWTQTVDQINLLQDASDSHASSIATHASAIATNTAAIAVNTSAVAALYSLNDAAAERAALAVGKLSAGASSGATTLSTSLLQFDLKNGDGLIAYDASAQSREELTVTANATAGATSISVSGVDQDLAADTYLYLAPSWMRSKISNIDTDIVAANSAITALGDTVAINSTAITANANEIALRATEISTVQSNLNTVESTLEASISVTANAVALKASQTEVDDHDTRILAAESSLIVTSEAITLANDNYTNLNGIVTSHTSTLSVHSAGIAANTASITAQGNTITGLQTDLALTDEAVSLHASRLDDAEGAINAQSSSITAQAGQIALKVSEADFTNAIKTTALTLINGAIDNPSVGSLTVDALTATPFVSGDVVLKSGQPLLILDLDDNSSHTVTVTSDVVYGATTIPITPVALAVADNSPVYAAPAWFGSQIVQTAHNLEFAVYAVDPDRAGESPNETNPGKYAYTTRTALNLDLDGITVEAKAFKSLNFNGAIDANGVITNPGTAGWAITGDPLANGTGGQFAASGAVLRGSLTLDVADIDVPGAEGIDMVFDASGGITIPMPTAANLYADKPNIIHWKQNGGTDWAAIGAWKADAGAGETIIGFATDPGGHSFFNHEVWFQEDIRLNGTVVSNSGINISADVATDFTVTDGSVSVGILALRKALSGTSALPAENLIGRIGSDAAGTHELDGRWLPMRPGEVDYLTATQAAMAGTGFYNKTYIDNTYYTITEINTELTALEGRILALENEVGLTPQP